CNDFLHGCPVVLDVLKLFIVFTWIWFRSALWLQPKKCLVRSEISKRCDERTQLDWPLHSTSRSQQDLILEWGSVEVQLSSNSGCRDSPRVLLYDRNAPDSSLVDFVLQISL